MIIAKETLSLPLGPKVTKEEFNAPARLGLSMYVCLVARHGLPDHYTTLISRVLEKTTTYASACYRHVYDTQHLELYDVLHQWSDGPRQFKSLEMPGTVTHLIPEYELTAVHFDYGCFCHWKGSWGTYIGRFKQALYRYALGNRIDTLEQVADILQILGRGPATRGAHPLLRGLGASSKGDIPEGGPHVRLGWRP